MNYFGYKPDPLSTRDASGNPVVGHRTVNLFKMEMDDNDFTTQLKVAAKQTHAGDVDLSGFTTQTNQYSLGSCAGNATADSIELLNAVQRRPSVQLSRLFVYSMARMLQDEDGDGRNDLNLDKGTYIRLCFEVLSRFGICREDDTVNGWPYDTNKVFVAPSLRAQRQATGHKIHSYYRIRTEGEDRLNDIIAALRANHPMVFGTKITSTFMQLRGEGPVGPPKSGQPTAGGHAMLCVGYDSQRGFLIKNSWGAGWGADGFCFFTPEYMTFEDTWDLWVPTLGMDFNASDPT